MALKIADIYFYLQLFPEISDTEIFVEVVIYLDFVCLEFNMGKANDGNFENS